MQIYYSEAQLAANLRLRRNMKGTFELTKAQIEQADNLEWFHALDFGEYQTAGRFAPDAPPNHTFFVQFSYWMRSTSRGCVFLRLDRGMVY